jgi:hypothetical protein
MPGAYRPRLYGHVSPGYAALGASGGASGEQAAQPPPATGAAAGADASIKAAPAAGGGGGGGGGGGAAGSASGMGFASARSCTVALLNTIVGAGMLGLPSAFAGCGYLLGMASC